MKKGSAERWRVIPEFPNYAVSSHGRVRNVNTGTVLRPSFRNGYPAVTLCNRGQQRKEPIHILVALAFIGPKPEGKEVAHWDDIKTNNRVENLRWATHLENCQDRTRARLPLDGKRLEAIVSEIPDPEIRHKFVHLATRVGIDEAVRRFRILAMSTTVRFPLEAA